MIGALAESQFVQDVFAGTMMSSGLFDPVRSGGQMMMGIDERRGGMISANPLSSSAPFQAGSTGTFLGSRGAAGTLFWGGMGVMPAVIGYQENGIQGALTAASGDVATHAALMRYHYTPAMQAGNVGLGGVVAPGIASGVGQGVSIGSRIGNTAAYAAKGVVGGFGGGFIGGMAGGWLGGKLGGGFGEFAGSIGGTFAGSYLATAAVSGISGMGLVGGGAAVAGISAVALGSAAVVGSAAAVGYGTYSTLKAGYQHRQMQKSIHTSGSLAAFHTQGAQTMRARAVQAIHKSHLNGRSALGQEANLMHMPSRNYHSKYRRFY